MRLITLVVVATVTIGCGGGSGNNSSRSPSAPTPTTAQVGGVWGYNTRLTSVSGGECVGAALQAAIGDTDSGTLQISQTGAALTATSTSNSDGSNCTYTGTAGASSIALNGTFCSIATITGIRCANGAVRDIRILTMGINATISGSTATGTSAETWNVFTTGGAAVGPMTLNTSFTGTRR